MTSYKTIKDNFAWYNNQDLKSILEKIPKKEIKNLERFAVGLVKVKKSFP